MRYSVVKSASALSAARTASSTRRTLASCARSTASERSADVLAGRYVYARAACCSAALRYSRGRAAGQSKQASRGSHLWVTDPGVIINIMACVVGCALGAAPLPQQQRCQVGCGVRLCDSRDIASERNTKVKGAVLRRSRRACRQAGNTGRHNHPCLHTMCLGRCARVENRAREQRGMHFSCKMQALLDSQPRCSCTSAHEQNSHMPANTGLACCSACTYAQLHGCMAACAPRAAP